MDQTCIRPHKTIKPSKAWAGLAEGRPAWIDATVALSLERSVTQVALSLDDPAPSQFLDLIAQQRELSDRLFLEAEERVAAIGALTTGVFVMGQTRELHASVSTLRAEVDVMLAVSAAERSLTFRGGALVQYWEERSEDARVRLIFNAVVVLVVSLVVGAGMFAVTSASQEMTTNAAELRELTNQFKLESELTRLNDKASETSDLEPFEEAIRAAG